jgi:hypothetical protein
MNDSIYRNTLNTCILDHLYQKKYFRPEEVRIMCTVYMVHRLAEHLYIELSIKWVDVVHYIIVEILSLSTSGMY